MKEHLYSIHRQGFLAWYLVYFRISLLICCRTPGYRWQPRLLEDQVVLTSHTLVYNLPAIGTFCGFFFWCVGISLSATNWLRSSQTQTVRKIWFHQYSRVSILVPFPLPSDSLSVSSASTSASSTSNYLDLGVFIMKAAISPLRWVT